MITILDGLDQPFTPAVSIVKTSKIFVQLGRYGDIFNVLPLAYNEYFLSGVRPRFMVAEEFASALAGVSYVVPVIFKGAFDDIHKAVFEASKLCPDVVLCQIYGKDLKVHEFATSFVRESWIQAGSKIAWGSLPLFIDRRDPVREYQLITETIPPCYRDFKIVLLALEGRSSPFPAAGRLRTELMEYFDRTEYKVIDISHLRAERIHDLLGLFDMAWCLVSVDTGLLHLAHASKIPVVSLITSRPSKWHGSAWRPNHVARFYYDEFPGALQKVICAVRDASIRRKPKIVHTWADFRDESIDETTSRRLALAASTWAKEYATGYWQPIEVKKDAVTRSGYGLGDDKPVPFLRDVIAEGLKYVGCPDDIVAVTNADVSFLPGITGSILDTVRRFGAAFTHRWDFERLTVPLINEAQIKAGAWYPGSDAFFFNKRWWDEFGHELPDLLMGREKNDEVFRQMIKRFGGVEIPACIYHEKHASFWERTENFLTNKGNQWNRKLSEKWVRDTGYMTDDWKWWPAIEGEWQPSCPRGHQGR